MLFKISKYIRILQEIIIFFNYLQGRAKFNQMLAFFSVKKGQTNSKKKSNATLRKRQISLVLL